MPDERVRQQFRDWCRNKATDADLELIIELKKRVPEDILDAIDERQRRRTAKAEDKEKHDKRKEILACAASLAKAIIGLILKILAGH